VEAAAEWVRRVSKRTGLLLNKDNNGFDGKRSSAQHRE
jgi:hypothetical protein